MPRPEFSPPILPSNKSPSSLHPGKDCGASWNMDFEIRVPYKSVDKYSDILPAIYSGDFGFGSDNAEDSFPPASSPEVKAALKKAIKGAKEILADYSGAGYIDAANKDVINTLIFRAEKYAREAKELWDWWDEHFQPDSEKPVYGWSLVDDRMTPCLDWAPAKAGIMSGGTEIEFTCPNLAHRDLHEGDRDVYATLIRAAMANIRCAQEAAAAVGIYNRNMEAYEGAVGGGMKLSTSTKKPSPGTRLSVSTVEPGDEPGEEDEPVEEAATPTTAKKKKGNGALLLGAAALGLLMMGKK